MTVVRQVDEGGSARSDVASDTFTVILQGEAAPVRSEPAEPAPKGRALLFVSIGATFVGLVIGLSAALLMPSASQPAPSEAAPTPVTTPDAPLGAEDVSSQSTAAGAETRTGIADLVEDAWVDRTADRTGIPSRVLRAYAGAAIAIADERPACGLGWNTLAGIGFVESEHGNIHGSSIGEDGDAEPAIFGIALDGTQSRAIRDSDRGVLDGDAEWDRAVGPMQFIPQTWEQWGRDANGDGVANPQNIDDAALSAAHYLCAGGVDLTDPIHWIAAVAAYNDTVEYNNRVADAATRYASN